MGKSNFSEQFRKLINRYKKECLQPGYYTADCIKGKRKVQGVPQLQTAALPRPQEEEETDKS